MSAGGAAPESGLRLSVLGPLEARLDGEILALGGVKQQMVLALLLLEAGHVVSSDRLIEWVWPGEEEDTTRRAATLQVYVSNLRRILDPATAALGRKVIVTRRPGYVIDADAQLLDLVELRVLIDQARSARTTGRPAAAVHHLRQALALWRGDVLSGLPIDVTTSAVVPRLDAERVALFDETASAELALGHHQELLEELPGWVDAHPLNERLRAHLMLALYRSGRQADALAVYQDARNRLVDELGIEPSRELRDLESQILSQDPALDIGDPVDADDPDHRNDLVDEEVASTEIRSSVVIEAAGLEIGAERIPLDVATFTIGRSPDRHLVISDSTASRRHAEIRRVGASYRIVDNGSANGTLVNGARVMDHELLDGDRLRIADTEMTFRSQL